MSRAYDLSCVISGIFVDAKILLGFNENLGVWQPLFQLTVETRRILNNSSTHVSILYKLTRVRDIQCNLYVLLAFLI